MTEMQGVILYGIVLAVIGIAPHVVIKIKGAANHRSRKE